MLGARTTTYEFVGGPVQPATPPLSHRFPIIILLLLGSAGVAEGILGM